MSNEVSPRAVWNVKILVHITILLLYAGLIIYGLRENVLTVETALGMIGSAALGGGVGWTMK